MASFIDALKGSKRGPPNGVDCGRFEYLESCPDSRPQTLKLTYPGLLRPVVVGGIPNRPHDAIPVDIDSALSRSRTMNFDTSPRVPIFAVPHVYSSDSAIEIAKRKTREASVRSVVHPWQSYPAEDCLNTLIETRWYRTL
jgi:hypothetical protein